MREYYVKQITVFGDEYKYYRGKYTSSDMLVTLGDFNDCQFETVCDISAFLEFVKRNEVCGYRYRESAFGEPMFELVKYKPEFKEFESHIEGYNIVKWRLDRHSIDGVTFSDILFQYYWFSCISNFIKDGISIPVSIADYIINYAGSQEFSSDLSSVTCTTASEIVEFKLSPESRALLAKLRLLR